MADSPQSKGRSPSTNVRVDSGGIAFIVGFWLWLFTIGYLHLSFWQGVLAIILWPYDLGVAWSSTHT